MARERDNFDTELEKRRLRIWRRSFDDKVSELSKRHDDRISALEREVAELREQLARFTDDGK